MRIDGSDLASGRSRAIIGRSTTPTVIATLGGDRLRTLEQGQSDDEIAFGSTTIGP